MKAYDGAVSVHLRHFPLPSHKQAEPGGRATQAAHRQGKGLEMADKVFANMRNLTDENFVTWAGELGLDVEKFKADYASAEVADEVAKDLAAGKAAGVRGTPTIFVNGMRYAGPRSLEGFKPVIDAEIKEADKLVAGGTSIDKVYEARSKANSAAK